MNRNYLIIALLVITLISGIVQAQDSLNVRKAGENTGTGQMVLLK
jgi:hypothetical protein